MEAADIAMWLGVLGFGVMVPQLVMGVFNLVTGKQDRERERLKALVRDRDEAESRFRAWDDYIILIRRQLIDAGVTPEPWPEIERLTDE